jgi:VanZ family protein
MHVVKKLLIDKKTGRVVDERKLKAKSRLKLLFLLLLIGLLRTIPDPHIENWIGMEYTWWLDQLIHLGFYFVVVMVLFWFLPAEKPTISFFFSLFSITLLFELAQLFIPGRGFTILDIVSNFVGMALAFLLRDFLNEREHRRAGKR